MSRAARSPRAEDQRVIVTAPGQGIALSRTQDRGSSSVDESPLDKWSAIEDLWLRLASCSTVSTLPNADGHGLVLVASNGRDAELTTMAADAGFYRWRCAAVTGSFLQYCERNADVLRCWLATPHVMAGWHAG